MNSLLRRFRNAGLNFSKILNFVKVNNKKFNDDKSSYLNSFRAKINPISNSRIGPCRTSNVSTRLTKSPFITKEVYTGEKCFEVGHSKKQQSFSKSKKKAVEEESEENEQENIGNVYYSSPLKQKKKVASKIQNINVNNNQSQIGAQNNSQSIGLSNSHLRLGASTPQHYGISPPQQLGIYTSQQLGITPPQQLGISPPQKLAISTPLQQSGMSSEVAHHQSSKPNQVRVNNTKGKNKTEVTDENKFDRIDLNKLGRVHPFSHLDKNKYTTNPNGQYDDYIDKKTPPRTRDIILRERDYICNNYAPLPVVCSEAKGSIIQDIEGFYYLDFLASYSAVNQGHCNEYIASKLAEQMNQLHITSRAFYNNLLYLAGKAVSYYFKYEKVLFMNSGVEAGESAVKIARRWAYSSKKIPEDQAKIVFAKGNFWGRSLYACTTSDDPIRYKGFGPFDNLSHYLVEYGNFNELSELLEKDKNICAVFLEPIQGENGVIIPPNGYLELVSKLCKKQNVLFIADEIQTGIGRTGLLLCCQHEGVTPDIVLLGKSLSGGFYPVSAVLSSKAIMDVIKPGEHGSTYGGNPLAAKACIESLNLIFGSNLLNISKTNGEYFGYMLKTDLENSRFVKEIRGRGLMYAIEFWQDCGYNAYDFSLWLMERGILCKPTKEFILRLSPPLVITYEQLERAADIISDVILKAEQFNTNFKPLESTSFNIISQQPIEKNYMESRKRNKMMQPYSNPAQININQNLLSPLNQIQQQTQIFNQPTFLNKQQIQNSQVSSAATLVNPDTLQIDPNKNK